MTSWFPNSVTDTTQIFEADEYNLQFVAYYFGKHLGLVIPSLS